MARAIFTNYGGTTLSASINNSVTAIDVVDGSVFPSPSGGNWSYLTIEQGSDIEIVRLTARSGNTLTVQRAQDGTTAKSFPDTATVSLRLTKAVLDEIHTDIAAAALTADWGSISSKPSTFTPAAHTHAIADVTGLQTALDGKASTTHDIKTITSGTTYDAVPNGVYAFDGNGYDGLSGFGGVLGVNANSARQFQLTVNDSNVMRFRRGHPTPNWDPWRTVWTDGNFDPTTKANLSGAAFTGAISTTGLTT